MRAGPSALRFTALQHKWQLYPWACHSLHPVLCSLPFLSPFCSLVLNAGPCGGGQADEDPKGTGRDENHLGECTQKECMHALLVESSHQAPACVTLQAHGALPSAVCSRLHLCFPLECLCHRQQREVLYPGSRWHELKLVSALAATVSCEGRVTLDGRCPPMQRLSHAHL